MATHTPTIRHDHRAVERRSAVQYGAMAFGIAFLLVGIAGFIPGITTHVDRLEWAGHHSGAELLGVFRVSVLHNVVHLLFGVAGLLLARRAGPARGYLLVGGIIYAALVVFGAVVDETSTANFVPVNDADDWLHLGLAIAMVLAGIGLPGPDARLTDDDRSADRSVDLTAGRR